MKMCDTQNKEPSKPETLIYTGAMQNELKEIAKILVRMEIAANEKYNLIQTAIVESSKVATIERDQIAYGIGTHFTDQSATNFSRFMCLEATLKAMWVQINKICEHFNIETIFEGYESEFEMEAYLKGWLKEIVNRSASSDQITGIQVIEQLLFFFKKQAEKKR